MTAVAPNAGVLGEQPVRLPKADLAASFARPARPGAGPAKQNPDRASGLRAMGLARPVQAVPAVEAEAPLAVRAVEPDVGVAAESPAVEAETQTAAADPGPVVRAPARRVADPQRPAPRRRGNQTVVAPIAVYMSPELRTALRRRRHDSRDTLTAIVLDAVEAVHHDLDRILEPHRSLPVTGGLFRHRSPTRPVKEEVHVQVGLRPAREDLAVIDALVEKHQAPDRSVLIAAALEHYLKA
jgi:hypothetical protein